MLKKSDLDLMLAWLSLIFSPEINSVNFVKVYTGSSADRAGLKEDDLVIEIDGGAIPKYAAKVVKKSVDKHYFYLLNTPIVKELISIDIQ
ncbi:PDZ domain-containing protein [Pseudoalteromonas arctica]|uniref:PDZ domain-containing protein n=1 Tax=Pseudoalteromonas arctica TaxID=394751 RepID=UPI0014754F38|nr:PDZ domain-containing protein [Pseudoalteromonas arctica]